MANGKCDVLFHYVTFLSNSINLRKIDEKWYTCGKHNTAHRRAQKPKWQMAVVEYFFCSREQQT